MDSDTQPMLGEFDATALSDAFKAISAGAAKTCSRDNSEGLTVSLRKEDPSARALIEWSPVNFPNGDPFRSFSGGDAIRMSLAAKIIEAHGGLAEQQGQVLRVRLPLAEE